ncbi:hypothetical protein JKP88DRAFT_332477 [Tribonema minus]|uniref:EF-hand domain-containing protein n=1 Tax=Tribonema minus TaxID=303371 RepID=A0A835YVM7_9STRA|nr:hypothetical protein JKP88DRAFT_332477 [Tribonema minus]
MCYRAQQMGALLGILSTNYATAVEVNTPASPPDMERGAAAPTETSKLMTHTKVFKDGNVHLRLAAVFMGIWMLGLGLVYAFGESLRLNCLTAMYRMYLAFFGAFIIALETRGPFNYLLRTWRVYEFARFLTLVWGRGIFYLYVGSLCFQVWDLPGVLLGSATCLIGLCMIVYGRSATVKLQYMQGQFTTEKDLRRAFDAFDVNRSAALEPAELAALCREMGALLTRAELETALLMLDRNANGKIEFDEFAAWWQGFQGGARTATGV